MTFMDKVNELAKNVAKDLKDVTKNLGDVTSETIESTKINAKIAPEKKSLDAELKKIGEYYYKQYRHGEELDEAVTEFCTQADIHYAKIEELREKAAEIEAARIRREEERAQAALETEAHFVEEEETEEAMETVETVEPEKHTEAAVACPDCGALNDAHMNYCCKCGAKLKEEEKAPAVAHCPNCGKEVAAGMNYCGECGTKISD